MIKRISGALPWPRMAVATVVIAVGAVAAMVVGTDRAPTALITTGVAVLVILCWTNADLLAGVAGASLTVEVVNGFPNPRMEVISIVLLGLVALRFRPRMGREGTDVLAALFILLLAVLTVRLGFGLARDAALPTLKFVTASTASTIVAALIALRVGAHRPLLLGYLASATASAGMALLQATGLDVIRTARVGANRFPGFANQVPGLSWYLVVAMMVGVALASTSPAGALRRLAVAAVLTCTAGLLVCGAQGGLVGLGFAVAALGYFAWRSIGRTALLHQALLAALVVGVILGAVAVSGLGASSVTGLAGDQDKGFENEVARVRSVQHGIDQLRAEPLSGIGTTAYNDRYDVLPHFFPLDLAVNSGAVGLLLGISLVGLLTWLVTRGPRDPTPSAFLGLGILATMFIQVLLTPAGPFADSERLTILGIAIAAAAGGSQPFARPSGHGQPGAPAPSLTDARR